MGLNNFFFIIHMIILLMIMSLLQMVRTKRWSHELGRVQIIALLLYSSHFVGVVDGRFAVSVAAVSLMAYSIGLLIDRAKQEDNQSSKPRKIAMWGGYYTNTDPRLL